MPITYAIGDATRPQGEGRKIIVHICNDRGAWGKGFVLAISRRWREPAEAYKRWFSERDGFGLGAVQFVQVEPDVWVANLIGQHGLTLQRYGLPEECRQNRRRRRRRRLRRLLGLGFLRSRATG